MNTYPTTNWKARLAVGAVTIAVAAGLLEVVTSGFLYPSADATAARVHSLGESGATPR